MALVKFYLKGSKEIKNIYLRFLEGRQIDITKSIGEKINRTQWNEKKGQPKPTSAENKKLITKLFKLSAHILEGYERKKENGEEVCGNWIDEIIFFYFDKRANQSQRAKQEKKNIIVSDNLTDITDYIIKTAPHRKNQKNGVGLSFKTIADYKYTKNILIQYEEQTARKYKAKDIDAIFFNNFYAYLLAQEYSQNTIKNLIKTIKATKNEAERLGFEVSKIKASQIIPIEKNKPLYLTIKEIEQIKNINLKDEEKELKNALKWLLIGCEIGQRGGDILNINYNNFTTLPNGATAIEIEQQKTGKRILIPFIKGLNDETQRLYNLKELPYKIKLIEFNKYLKILGQRAKIDEPTTHPLIETQTGTRKKRREIKERPKWRYLSSHICRRSFASNYYGKIPTPLLKEITGHSTEEMLLKYIGKTAEEKALQLLQLLENINLN